MTTVRRFWRGWTVRALFGQTTTRRAQAFLSLLVVAAIAWPILLAGIVAPKPMVQLVAFVPLPDRVPSWTVRVVWCGLALLVPIGIGIAVAIKAPRAPHPQPLLIRILLGFPITVGLAAAFLIIFVSVPVMRIAAIARKQKSADIPLMADVSAYHDVANKICEVLNRQGFSLRRAEPGWWVTAPMRLLARLGGDAFRSQVPRRIEYFVTDGLELSLYPSGLLLRGNPGRLTWAHGLIAETVVHTEALQTSDPKAQALERRLRPLWKSYDLDPQERTGATDLGLELDEITFELRALQVDWDDWQILYRQILQLGRAVHGEQQLLDDGPPSSPEPSAGDDAR